MVIAPVQSPQAAFTAALLELDATSSLTAPAPVAANDSFPAAVAQANVQTPAEASTAEGLLLLNTPTLTLFNEVDSDPASADVSGTLNTTQLQELDILRQDAQRIEDAAALSIAQPLTSAASTVDLTPAGQAVVAANGNVAELLTPEQMVQVQQIIAPFLGEPLTPALTLQIQEQFAAAGFNPVQISLATLLMAQSFVAGEQPATQEAVEAHTVAEEAAPAPDEPVSALDAVAVEDSAIL